MIIEFSVSNFRSFYTKCTLTLQAQTAIKDEPRCNCFTTNGYTLMKTAAVYGANSSGKSNLLSALGLMGNIVLESVKLNDGEPLRYDPFMLAPVSDTEPTMFEILFLLDGVRYRYGFEYTENEIEKEWLFAKKGRLKENELFIRVKKDYSIHAEEFPEGDKDITLNENRLFLSLIAQLGGNLSKRIIKWFEEDYNVISGLSSKGYGRDAAVMLHKKLPGYEQAVQFFQKMQLGFTELSTKEEDIDIEVLKQLPPAVKESLIAELAGKKAIELFSAHNKYSTNGEVKDQVLFQVQMQESQGTQKLISLSMPIFKTLIDGSTLFIDELDAKMHPLISEQIIRLFNDTKTNPNNAQLVFTTHDTHLLSADLLRRDQIWFTEKDHVEQTDLYSMTDIVLPNGQKPRTDSNYEKNYIAGRYGAIPFIS